MEILIAAIVGFVTGAVVSYLFLRANRQKKAVVDAFTDRVSDRLKE